MMKGQSRETGVQERFPLHPSERRLIEYLRRLRYGTIANLKVQDGLPMLVEQVTRKVTFTANRTESNNR